MKNQHKNLILVLHRFHQFLDEYVLHGQNTLLMHYESDIVEELLKVKDQEAKNIPQGDAEADETQIKIERDLTCAVIRSEEDFSDLVKELETKELLILELKNPEYDEKQLQLFIENLRTKYQSFNLNIIVKTTSEEFNQKKYDQERLSDTVDEQYQESMRELLPIQSHNMKNFHELQIELQKKQYSYLIQQSTNDQRVDYCSSVKELEQWKNISGHQLNLPNFWREVLFVNGKFPKFGA